MVATIRLRRIAERRGGSSPSIPTTYTFLMFLSLNSHRNGDVLHYTVNDTCFTVINCIADIKRLYGTSKLVAILAIEYSKQPLPVARVASNIARYYVQTKCKGNNINEFWIREDAGDIQSQFPNLKYKENYLECVIRQFKQLQFGTSSTLKHK